MKTTVPENEIEQCWDMLRRKVSDAGAGLPEGTSVKVQDDFGLVYGMFYALTGDGTDERKLSDYARLIQRELTNIEDVGRVTIYGEREECINIEMLPERMATLGVSPAEVLTTLQGQNGIYYTGYYDNGPKRVRVTVNDKFRKVEQIRNISQAELVILMALYNHIANLLYLAEFVIDSHAHAFWPVVVISGIIDAILPLQRGEYLRRRNAQCRHTFRQHLNVDALLSFSVYSDTSHVFNVCQLPLDQSGIVG